MRTMCENKEDFNSIDVANCCYRCFMIIMFPHFAKAKTDKMNSL